MNKNGDKFGLKLSLLVAAASLLVLLWGILFTGKNSPQQSMIKPDGQLNIMGITLARSSLRESEIALKSRSDTALYIYPSEHDEPGRRLEAFFPAIADHSKVILHLRADTALLDSIEKRSSKPRLYPDGVARRNLAPVDITRAQQLTVERLTLIPSVKIDEETLTARFGQPQSKSTEIDGTLHLNFPDSGLKASIDSEGTAILRFSRADKTDSE